MFEMHLKQEPSFAGQPLGLATDRVTGNVYLYTTEALMDVGSDGEDKDIWNVYLEMRDYSDALRVCRTTAQRDEVYTKQAEDALMRDDNITAARTYAKVITTECSLVLGLCGNCIPRQYSQSRFACVVLGLDWASCCCHQWTHLITMFATPDEDV